MIKEIDCFNIEIIDLLKKISGFDLSIDDFSKIYIYLLDNNIVGFINYSFIYERAELNYIYVVDKFRNNGIGIKLLDFFENDCVKSNIKNITLEVSEDNLPAIKLYIKKNFKTVSIRKNYYGNKNAVLMIREFD